MFDMWSNMSHEIIPKVKKTRPGVPPGETEIVP